MAQTETINFKVLSSRSLEIVGESTLIKAVDLPPSFVADNAHGHLRQITRREEISNMAEKSALSLKNILNA